MTAIELARSARQDPNPAADLGEIERGLWLALAGRWDAAHDLCQDLPNPAGAWLHAWLHRQEGDHGNARYWYSRAGKPAPDADADLESEWMQIATDLLEDPGRENQ